MEWINAIDAAALTAWSTVVLTFATVVLAVLTGWLALEQRRTRRDSVAPDVVVTIEPAHQTILQVCVQNIGRGPAMNVRVTSTPPLAHQKDNGTSLDLSETKSLNPSFLGPGQKIGRWLGYFWFYSNKIYAIKVKFQDCLGRDFERDYVIEVEMYDGSQFYEDPLLKIAKHTETLAKGVGNLTNWTNRINVNVHTAKDRAAEDAAQQVWMQEMQSKSKGQ